MTLNETVSLAGAREYLRSELSADLFSAIIALATLDLGRYINAATTMGQ